MIYTRHRKTSDTLSFNSGSDISFIDIVLKYTKYRLMNDDVLVYMSTVRFVQSS